MNDTITDRAILLIETVGLSALAETGTKEYFRWQNIKRKKARVGAEEIERLATVLPQYRWWLVTGEVMPDKGQMSPTLDEISPDSPIQSETSR
ncbi:DNA-binding protein [Pseudomonas sp. Gutcm_11s]|uniref:DNA-binding protein n=1 Tax=Pseudomonas sp. Gutcm_11s TaxID=3026088 RepID=UPI00235FD64F|nr:DNA-binding protein [Pseudomonas sp. Gutcm_11s]MDD0844617.1 DNA-binding protein [Pseudomonas sp. Gutcm_11s]